VSLLPSDSTESEPPHRKERPPERHVATEEPRPPKLALSNQEEVARSTHERIFPRGRGDVGQEVPHGSVRSEVFGPVLHVEAWVGQSRRCAGSNPKPGSATASSSMKPISSPLDRLGSRIASPT